MNQTGDGRQQNVTPNGLVEEFSEEQARALFDARARYHLNISGDEFLRQWHAGVYEGEVEDTDVAAVAMLLPLVERMTSHCPL